ncbi:PilT/PilU family type 4a pilus ATPase [uncultured Thiothrix sp.]|uniref:PilT/PilU family type 4a pilus ATPase n=1 Tax=uncultured Thiothrix sp. TaxID=223185 RepID=UPI002602D062|nr:PilT/PilU family type 4a pilus ATPase [uncultured Thiothrix sp.]HMT91687.1 PilT/PilU family type 4a pilus ATPase [Thiolinea sp.]
MALKDYLRILATRDGSDLYLTADAPPAAKFQGSLKPLARERLSPEDVHTMAYELMDADQRQQFEHKPEMNLAISEEGIGRFRVNIFKQRHKVAMVIRNIKTEIPDANKIGLPEVLKNVIMEKRGLILFVGGTGSGKSTSLAALIDYRNRNSDGHIITIEDPIEYVHPHRKSIISQREVGVDTDSYEDALKNTLRQAPDVILIGEIRTRETMEHALAFAETGHLCLSTLHANSANQALDRIINFFPEERHHQLLQDLSLNLKAFISQRLIPTIEGKRTAAIEILLGTPIVRDLIIKGDVGAIKEIMEKSEQQGMQTFDGHLYRLYREKKITLEDALRNADSASNLKLRINLSPDNTATGNGEAVKPAERLSALEGLSLEPKAEEVEEEAF